MNFIDKLIHAIVVGLLIGGISYLLKQFDFYNQASRGKQLAIFAAVAFVVILILNLLWPFPS